MILLCQYIHRVRYASLLSHLIRGVLLSCVANLQGGKCTGKRGNVLLHICPITQLTSTHRRDQLQITLLLYVEKISNDNASEFLSMARSFAHLN